MVLLRVWIKENFKKLYPNSYVKETYSLFLELCLRLLKPNGILTFILPDTFMSLIVIKI